MIKKAVLVLLVTACAAARIFGADSNAAASLPGRFAMSFDTLGSLTVGPGLSIEVQPWGDFALGGEVRMAGLGVVMPLILKVLVPGGSSVSFGPHAENLDYRVSARFYFPQANMVDRWYLGLSGGQSFWSFDYTSGSPNYTMKVNSVFLGLVFGARRRSSRGFFVDWGGVLGPLYVYDLSQSLTSDPSQTIAFPGGTSFWYPWGTMELSIGFEI